MKKIRISLAGVSFMSLISVVSCGAASAQTAVATAGESTTGDIIVTANKRNERELDIAGAIKAFSGDQLLSQGISSMKDYATLTPGLQINQSAGGGAPTIRGITIGVETGTTTAIVVNGAQIGSSATVATGALDSLDLDPIDLQRVEILKGPQGTLYGANSLSGIISYTLREPSLTKVEGVVRGEVDTTEHGAASWSLRGAVSLPLITDKLAIRLSGYRNRKGGFIDNNVRGISNQNDGVTWGLNGSILAKPTERLNILVTGFYQDTRNNRDTVIYNFATRAPRGGDLHYDDYLFPSYRNLVRAGVATIDYDFDFAKLTSVSAYQNNRSNTITNANSGPLGALVPLLPVFGGAPFPMPAAASIDVEPSTVKKFTEELRLTSTGDGPLQWIVGGYYANESDFYNDDINVRTLGGVLLPNVNPYVAFGEASTYREYAGFGNLTYKFSEAFDITGGVRVGRIEQTYQQTFFGAGAPGYNGFLALAGLPPIPASIPKVPASKTVVNYLATARYHLSRDTMLFARFATGFRPGGPNLPINGLPPTYNPDTTDNYEAGIKSKFWGGKGTIDLVGYYTKWKGILVPVTAGNLSGVGNGGNARVYGVESSLTLRPVTGLSLTAAMAYSNGKFDKLSPQGVGFVSVGDMLPNNPRWSGSLVADYRFPTGGRWEGVVGTTARFVGSRHALPASSAIYSDYVMPSYSLFDAHAGLQSNRFDVDLFVRNLTDKRAQLGAATTSGFAEVTVQRPRTFGVAVTARY
jgi:iron complex outermembrane receptor protein